LLKFLSEQASAYGRLKLRLYLVGEFLCSFAAQQELAFASA